MQLFIRLFFFFTPVVLWGQQYQSVVFNYEKSFFGENEPLPAESHFMLHASVMADIDIVEVALYSSSGKPSRAPLYKNRWKRSLENETAQQFNIPFNYKLRQNTEYDIRINFYRALSTAERDSLRADLFHLVDSYIDQSYRSKGKRFKLLSSHKDVIRDLNTLVERGLSRYQSRTQFSFEGFSKIVEEKVKAVQKFRNNASDSTNTRAQALNQLKALLHYELNQFLKLDLYRLFDDRYVDDYPTEKTRAVLALNAGYAAIPFEFTNAPNYGHAPYLGLSFPLGKKAFSPFWHRMAFSVGAFLQRPLDTDERRVDAPFTGIPLYAALGIRPWRFLRLHVGATALEGPDNAPNIQGLERGINVRPFIGLSIEFNLWMNLAE